MLARDSEVLADDSRHVSFEALAIYTDPTTRKSVANAARYAYTREHKPWIVTFTRDHDLAKSRMIDDLRGPKRLLAQRGPKRLLAQRWPAAGNLGSRPCEGVLPLAQLTRLAEVLTGRTCAPERCWFGIREGFGDLPCLGSLRSPRLPMPQRSMIDPAPWAAGGAARGP